MRSALPHTLALMLVTVSCSSGDDPSFGSGGPGRDFGADDDGLPNPNGENYLDAPPGDVNVNGPAITILAPTTGGLVFSNEMLVRATVTDDGLDAASVMVGVVRDVGDPPITERRMDLVDASMNLWEATVPLGGAPGGELYVEVSARDTDETPNGNKVELLFIHDDGPDVEFLSPPQDDLYFRGALSYAFRVLYDQGTAPTTCTLDEVSVKDQQFTPTLTVQNPCTWEGSFDFAADFMPDLIDNRYVMVVRATNNNATQATALRTFSVDSRGPEITFHEDYVTANDIISGTVEIRVQITDPSGVAPSTVVAEVAGTQTEIITLLLVAPDEYSAIYDTSELGDEISTVTIEVTAEDLWGTEGTASIQVHIDNAPPVISMHPPSMRNSKLEGTDLKCSWRFDPVGYDSADDVDDVDFDAVPGSAVGDSPKWCQPQVFFVRARVEDIAHQRPGQLITYPSYVNPDTVELFAYPGDGTEPLIVDVDGDGFCDDINPSLEPTPDGLPDEAWHNTLHPIPATGSENFTPDLSVPGGCLPGTDAQPPATLCTPTTMTSASFQGANSTAAEIFTLGVPQPGADCSGTQFDARGNGFGTGWICFAARARDNVGNLGISDPMRVYVDLSGNFCQSPPNPNSAPSCTDGCAYVGWTSNVFPPFPQKFISSGEIHRVN